MNNELKCPHCNGDFEIEAKPEQKSFLLTCKKCGCVYRLVLVFWNKKCYMKYYKEVESKKPKPEHIDFGIKKEKKKRKPYKKRDEEW